MNYNIIIRNILWLFVRRTVCKSTKQKNRGYTSYSIVKILKVDNRIYCVHVSTLVQNVFCDEFKHNN